MANEAVYGSLAFDEQIEFFRRKLSLPTNGWTDVYNKEHDWAFVVAGANRDDVLTGFRQAIDKAISNGTTLQAFRKDFDKIVEATGWQYNGGRNWRSRIIYETNLRQSYNAGREAQIQLEKKFRPYKQYQHNDSGHPRPQHKAWDGLILAVEDPWWDSHSPMNGWGCKCSVQTLAERDLKAEGLTVGKAPAIHYEDKVIGKRSPQGPITVRVPKGIDPGFEYAPGKARLKGAMPPERPLMAKGSAGSAGLPNRGALSELPAARKLAKQLMLPADLTDAQYSRKYLNALGIAGEEGIFKDVVGENIVVGNKLFQTPDGKTKIKKRGREQYLLVLAEALKSPDEIWARLEWIGALGVAVIRRRYVARFIIEGEPEPMLAVFERGQDGWQGITTFQSTTQDVDDWRVGVRLYRRPE